MSFQLHAESFLPKNLIRLIIHPSGRHDLAALALLFAAWAGAILLVNPVGDFPLNDDFSYGKSVRNLVIDGKFLLDSWLAQTLAAQVIWGAAFCKAFGFSFTVLRFSTLVVAFAGVGASYFMCRELGRSRRLALLFATTIAFNPLFFSLSFTFMTDVPFFAFATLSTLFFVKALRTKAVDFHALSHTTLLILLGSFFALAATFVRQTGLMLPVAFAFGWLFRGGFRWKTLLVALLPATVIFAAFFGYNHWLEQRQGLPPGYGNFSRLAQTFDASDIFSRILPRTGILLAYLGAFFLPLSLALVKRPVRTLSANRSVLLILIFCLLASAFAWEKLPWANQLYNFGLGPKLLKDSQFFINVSPILPESAVIILKIAALASGILLTVLLLKKVQATNLLPSSGGVLRPRNFFLAKNAGSQNPAARSTNSFFALPERLPVIFAGVNLALYLAFLMIDLHFFDRYFLQLLPFLGVCLLVARPHSTSSVNKSGSFKSWAMAFSLLAMATFSIAATHDYLAWNRARWQALDFLTRNMKIPPRQIDGGFEFNGWHKPGEREYGRRKSWWWVNADDYIVTFGDEDGFSKMKGFAFKRWLPPGVDSVFVLKKQ